MEPGTEDWILSDEQHDKVSELMDTYRKQFPALFIAVPWDEEEVGGCVLWKERELVESLLKNQNNKIKTARLIGLNE